MNTTRLDEIDHKLLSLLQADARLDVSRLAALVNLSKTPVHRRLERLQASGIIKGFTTVLDREKLGQPVLVVLQVRLRETGKSSLAEFERVVAVLPEVQNCLQVAGDWDFILQVNVRTPQAYTAFLMERICSQENVADVESAFVLRECKSQGCIFNS